MSILDLAIIALYLAGVVLAGGWFGRRQVSTSRYFFGGRQMPWWAVSASIVATETSTITFISIPGIAYARGGNFTFLQLVFGYLTGRLVISAIFIPRYFEGKLATSCSRARSGVASVDLLRLYSSRCGRLQME